MTREIPFTYTHAQLVGRAGEWLRGTARCPIVFTEIVSMNSETPDAIGWRNSARESLLVECKASRSDFLADKRKGFRRDAEFGMGLFRYYLCPPGVIRVEDLPPHWGLLYCHPQKVEVIHGPNPRRYDMRVYEDFVHRERNVHGELRMFYSALSRLKLDLGENRFHERVHMPYKQRKHAPLMRGQAAQEAVVTA
jgi:hypothetical protein